MANRTATEPTAIARFKTEYPNLTLNLKGRDLVTVSSESASVSKWPVDVSDEAHLWAVIEQSVSQVAEMGKAN